MVWSELAEQAALLKAGRSLWRSIMRCGHGMCLNAMGPEGMADAHLGVIARLMLY